GLARRAVAGVEPVLGGAVELLGDPGGQRAQDRRARLEVEVERRARDAGPARELLDADPRQRTVGKEPLGGLEDRALGHVPAALAATARRAGPGRWLRLRFLPHRSQSGARKAGYFA